MHYSVINVLVLCQLNSWLAERNHMRMREEDKILPDMPIPKGVCIECGKPLYDGRKHICDACKAAKKKCSCKKPAVIERYARREELLAAIDELSSAIQMQEWLLQESKKKLNLLKEVAFNIK